MDCVRAAPRKHAALAVLEDKDRGFPRNPGDLAENEFVGHQIAKHSDRDVGKGFDNPPQPLGLFEMLAHL